MTKPTSYGATINARQKAETITAEMRETIRNLKDISALVAFVDMVESTALSWAKPFAYKEAVGHLFFVLQRFQVGFGDALKIKIAKTRGDGAMLVKMLEGGGADRPKQVCDFCCAMVKLANLFDQHSVGLADGVALKIAIGLGEDLVDGRAMWQVFLAENGDAKRKKERSVPVSEHDVWGLRVNLAARVESLATRKQILVDDNVAQNLVLGGCNPESDELRLVIPKQTAEVAPGYPFSVKGYGKDLLVNQIVRCPGPMPELDTHLLNSYSFAALVLLRMDRIYLNACDENPTEEAKSEVLKRWHKSFPSPLGVAIYLIRKPGLIGIMPTSGGDRNWHLLAVVAASDLGDYARRLQEFIMPTSASNRLFIYSVTVPLVCLPKSSFRLSVVPAFRDYMNGTPQLILPDKAVVWLARYGSYELPEVGTLAWRSIGMYDWVEIREENDTFELPKEGKELICKCIVSLLDRPQQPQPATAATPAQ